ncbi:MAG: HAD family hydrolase, partial [Legionellales bacterium]
TVHLCTGADLTTATKYALLLGIPKENIAANTVGTATRPGDKPKSSYIAMLKNKGHKVAMVGDALNDVVAIKNADVGIAVTSSIGEGSTEKYAGIVIQKGLLFPIATAFDVAEKTNRNIFQNLVVSITYNSAITLVAAGLFVAAGFVLHPAVGVLCVVIESTLIFRNLYRLKQQKIVSATAKNEQAEDGLFVSSTATLLSALGPKQDLADVEEFVNSKAWDLFPPVRKDSCLATGLTPLFAGSLISF